MQVFLSLYAAAVTQSMQLSSIRKQSYHAPPFHLTVTTHTKPKFTPKTFPHQPHQPHPPPQQTQQKQA